MTDKQEHNNPQHDPLMDTQRLLLGVDMSEVDRFSLEEILAEFGGGADAPGAVTPAVDPLSEEPEEPEEPAPEEAAPAPPEPPPREAEESGDAEESLSEEALLDQEFWDELLSEDDLILDNGEDEEPPAFVPAKAERAPEAAPSPPPEAREETQARKEAEEPPPSVSMEDVVASTVDAVKEEQERRQERLRRRLEKLRGKKERRPVKRREPSARPPLPEPENEPSPGEAAVWHKRRLRECRRGLALAAPVVMLMWLPWVLEYMEIRLPFFSASLDNAALCVLVPQVLASILCWPVFRAAVEGFRSGTWSVHATALLSTAVTLLDEATLMLLPERSDASPLGGIAAVLSLLCLWALRSFHRGMAETFRTAAMGAPSQVAACCEHGVARGAGSGRGFYTRACMEDTASQWQRLLLPVLAAASLVFAVLSSMGQERSQDFLWCWSVVLCASSSLVFPLAFFVPFGRLSTRLARTGAAVAGQYGAAELSMSRRLVVTDSDLFPPGAASLSGVKLYGEERSRAISYAATLAAQGGGLLGRVFDNVCQSGQIARQPLEHFHIHEDGGLSGMIHGETVLVGPPAFMRRKAVRLPAKLPSRTAVCLAVDGELTAMFGIKYTAADTVELALRTMRRNGLLLTLATRDGLISPKLLRARFGADFGAERLELSDRLALSDPEREAEGPSGLLYREGLLPFVSLAAGSRRLCQTVRVGNLISIFSSIAGALLGFYLTFTGSYAVLTPILLLTYLLLWAAPMLPLVWTVDNI